MRKRDRESVLAQRQEQTLWRDLRTQKRDSNGLHLRISRTIDVPQVLKGTLEALKPLHDSGVLVRKGIGSLALTVFDSSQRHYKLRPDAPRQLDGVVNLLRSSHPDLFEQATAQVKGLQIFGGQYPFVGVVFEDGPLQEEQIKTVSLLTHRYEVDKLQNGSIRPHVSVARLFSVDRAKRVNDDLMDTLPAELHFNPAEVVIKHKN